MTANLMLLPKQSKRPVQLAIEATVIDTQAIRQRQEEERLRRQEIERKRQQEEEARRADERRKQEEQERNEEQARVAEQRRKEEAERKKQENERRQAEEKRQKAEQTRIAEQRKKEEAERQRRAEEERKRVAEEKRRADERQAELQQQLAEEEQRFAAVSSGLLDQWREVIRQRVQRNWVRPASAKPGLDCEVRVSQLPSGDVVDVRIIACNGDAGVERSIVNAVLKSSPLPKPQDPSLFERVLIFNFKPEE